MAKTFFGPWKVVKTHRHSFFQQSLVITGSGNADGRYDVFDQEELEILVQGIEWQLEIQFVEFPSASEVSWQPSDVRRSTRFEPEHGLIVQLDEADRPPGSFNPEFKNLSLVCTSMDPAVNPNPTSNPYDFTLPEHG